MLFESKRLLELAGLPHDESSRLLKESAEGEIEEFSSDDGVTEYEKNEKDSYNEADSDDEKKIRETIRSEIESMWASGQVFGNRSKAKKGEVTMGFLGVGFKR